ncbi:MAG: efflux RND transporter periplasmic adaptor subunit [Candidatus Omnitrophota bacterium]
MKLKLNELLKKVKEGQKAQGPEFTKRFMNRKFLIPAIGAVVAFFFLFSFVKDHIACVGGFPVYKKTKKEAPKPPEEIPLPVKAYKVARVNFRDTLPALGSIKGFRDIELKFQSPGVVEYINFKEGEKITQGDIIASLDQKEQLLKLEYAKVELDKQAALFELGSILETKLRQSQLEYQSAKVELDKTNLVALSDGYIGSLKMDRGSTVSPQEAVAIFVDVKDVYAEFGIIEKDISKVKEGQNAEVSVESYPDQIFKGQVDSVSPLVDERSRTIKVRSRISNVDEKVRPGMFGRVNVLVYEKDDALVIPSSAFKKKEDQYFVYLVHPEEPKPLEEPEAEEAKAKKSKKKGKKEKTEEPPQEAPVEAGPAFGIVEIRTIEVSYATPDAIEVKEGLEEGDLVIVDVEQEIQDKARVEITETQEGIF